MTAAITSSGYRDTEIKFAILVRKGQIGKNGSHPRIKCHTWHVILKGLLICLLAHWWSQGVLLSREQNKGNAHASISSFSMLRHCAGYLVCLLQTSWVPSHNCRAEEQLVYCLQMLHDMPTLWGNETEVLCYVFSDEKEPLLPVRQGYQLWVRSTVRSSTMSGGFLQCQNVLVHWAITSNYARVPRAA